MLYTNSIIFKNLKITLYQVIVTTHSSMLFCILTKRQKDKEEAERRKIQEGERWNEGSVCLFILINLYIGVLELFTSPQESSQWRQHTFFTLVRFVTFFSDDILISNWGNMAPIKLFIGLWQKSLENSIQRIFISSQILKWKNALNMVLQTVLLLPQFQFLH